MRFVPFVLLTLLLPVWVGGCPAITNNTDNSQSGSQNSASVSDGTNASAQQAPSLVEFLAGSTPTQIPTLQEVIGDVAHVTASGKNVRVQIVNESALRAAVQVVMSSSGVQVRLVRGAINAGTTSTIIGPDNADVVSVSIVPDSGIADQIDVSFVASVDFSAGDTLVIRIPEDLGRIQPEPQPPFTPDVVEPAGVDTVEPDVVTPAGGGPVGP